MTPNVSRQSSITTLNKLQIVPYVSEARGNQLPCNPLYPVQPVQCNETQQPVIAYFMHGKISKTVKRTRYHRSHTVLTTTGGRGSSMENELEESAEVDGKSHYLLAGYSFFK